MAQLLPPPPLAQKERMLTLTNQRRAIKMCLLVKIQTLWRAREWQIKMGRVKMPELVKKWRRSPAKRRMWDSPSR
jgi:hypothetical protein